jgi:hypothetical protein
VCSIVGTYGCRYECVGTSGASSIASYLSTMMCARTSVELRPVSSSPPFVMILMSSFDIPASHLRIFSQSARMSVAIMLS